MFLRDVEIQLKMSYQLNGDGKCEIAAWLSDSKEHLSCPVSFSILDFKESLSV